MRYAHKVDSNQAKIVSALRAIGATVTILSAVGKGCPDLCVGIFRRNYLLEVKDGDKPPSAQAMTSEEAIWHNEWKGQAAIVRNVKEALAAVGATMQ